MFPKNVVAFFSKMVIDYNMCLKIKIDPTLNGHRVLKRKPTSDILTANTIDDNDNIYFVVELKIDSEYVDYLVTKNFTDKIGASIADDFSIYVDSFLVYFKSAECVFSMITAFKKYCPKYYLENNTGKEEKKRINNLIFTIDINYGDINYGGLNGFSRITLERVREIDLDLLSNLVTLEISNSPLNVLNYSGNKLKKLKVKDCDNLTILNVPNIKKVYIRSCPSLKKVNLKGANYISIFSSFKITTELLKSFHEAKELSLIHI
jgi:hypothetical protein